MSAVDPAGAEAPGGEPRTILFVEDEVIISMVTSAMIADLGYRVLEAYSGAQALKMLAESPVDLLITDYSMPGMTGAQLVKAARDLRPGLRVLVATGYAELPGGLDAGVPHLSKPYEMATLRAAIDKALAG